MASFDGAYDSLTQGVSQQVPTSRLDGQVTEQINMVSDVVTGVRRRVGAKLRFTMKSDQVDHRLIAWKTDVGGIPCECYLNPVTGELILLEEGKVSEMVRFQSDYLRATDPHFIRYTGVGDSLFIANTSQIPYGKEEGSAKQYRTGGFINITGSALTIKFEVAVSDGQATYSGDYTTPDGKEAEHANQVSTSYVASKLVESLKAKSGFNDNFNIWVDGAQIFVKSKHNRVVRITPKTAKLYMETSLGGHLTNAGSLPSSLPESADGLILSVGKVGGQATYFRYESNGTRWVEDSLPGSYTHIHNMPVEVYWDGDDWVMDTDPYPGREAGDDDTNPNPEFIDWGITGVSSYQGRLVILSGSWVYLSASHEPKQFYRSTVEELIDSDPIGIGSSSAGSANFKYGVVFNKDLLLFSPEHQALIPGLNQAITPKNAHILVTSTYTADMLTSPVTLGSSIMYPFPRSSTHYGILELIPSVYTDSMYSSVDSSEHIPRYMEGRCRFAVASTVSNLVVFGSTVNRKVLYVHEYMWNGEEKVLKSWHKWEFPADIAYAFFSGELINILFVDNSSGTIFVTSVDPKAVGSNSETYFLDYYIDLPVESSGEDLIVRIPEEYRDYMVGQGLDRDIRVAYMGGDLNSVEIGSETCPECKIITLNPSTTAQRVVVGVPFVSQLTPSPPTFRDYKERPIVFNKVQLMKMYVRTNRSGEFEVIVRDKPRGYTENIHANPVRWLSRDLNLGKLPVGGLEGNIIPCRVDASSGEVDFISKGLNELNIVTIEYTCRGSRMRQRR